MCKRSQARFADAAVELMGTKYNEIRDPNSPTDPLVGSTAEGEGAAADDEVSAGSAVSDECI